MGGGVVLCHERSLAEKHGAGIWVAPFERNLQHGEALESRGAVIERMQGASVCSAVEIAMVTVFVLGDNAKSVGFVYLHDKIDHEKEHNGSSAMKTHHGFLADFCMASMDRNSASSVAVIPITAPTLGRAAPILFGRPAKTPPNPQKKARARLDAALVRLAGSWCCCCSARGAAERLSSCAPGGSER